MRCYSRVTVVDSLRPCRRSPSSNHLQQARIRILLLLLSFSVVYVVVTALPLLTWFAAIRLGHWLCSLVVGVEQGIFEVLQVELRILLLPHLLVAVGSQQPFR